jgi:formamidopyrimidine-DNA glycosylase
MPELPEITVIARQMNKELRGKQVASIEITQPKILNVSTSGFTRKVEGKRIAEVSSLGKWLFIKLNMGYTLLINLGMGADLVYFKPGQQLPDKYQFKLGFSDNTGFTARFWWFGYVHLVQTGKLADHKMTAALGKSPMEDTFTMEYFKNLVMNKKGGVKRFLLDQKNVAGIGNVYIQDVLFKTRLHPNRNLSSLTNSEIKTLYNSLRQVLKDSIKLGGLAYERDFYGKKGRYSGDKFLVGYRQGKPCPSCGSIVEKIRTGNTSSYICSKCQKLDQ